MKKIALTGIKPTGSPHIGNFLGAIQPALELTKDHDALYFIADYHAMTSVKDKTLLREQIYSVAATWLAAGLDPDKTTFYRQSDIPEVFELTWILSCLAPKGLLNRAHSYKDSVDKNIAGGNDPDFGVNCGLYNYPVLMAADILMFGSQIVPVGQDQKQHLEITRDIAQIFNQTYGEILTLPEALIQENVKTVPGIDGRKMSKSYNNVIPIYTSSKKLRKVVNQIVTDSKGVEEVKDPAGCNLFAIYSQFASPESIEKTRQQYLAGGLAYGELKKECFGLIDKFFAEGCDKFDLLMEDKPKIDAILADGAKKARSIATPLLKKIRKAIGIQ
ncbi:MAG: tryptophan--tRNA ligase [Proteobacteria bacterium]|nr:tryptophan--tRNA ligase [Pseudomonadota bacterium]